LFDSYEEAKKNWQYHTHNYYLPANTTPSKSFVNAYAASHVQGFVHTNSTLHPYAGTYSNRSTTDKPGWLFVVDDHGGDLRLDSLHHTFSRHPTGASILGARMWYGDKLPEGGPYRLRSLIVDSWFSTDLGTLELPKAFEPGPTMGGGVGLAKLASGGHLLITVGPGDNTEAPHWDFFFVMGKPNGPQSVSPLGTISPGGEYDANITALSRWRNSDANNGFVSSQSQFQWSENISVITECGTGDIYVINSTSENGAKMLFGKGYYRLSRVDWDTLADHNRPSGAPKGASGPVLVPVAMGWQDLNSHECMQRAAATAYVTKDHDLELYCSEYEAIEGEEKMHFIRRRKK
jgi:hypothetical protein